MSAASVQPTSLPISGLLSSRFPAFVPRYRRCYAWEGEQINDLINDVKLLLPTQTTTHGHFYVGMVAINISDSSEPGGIVYEIVDGQQKLARFCLLLAQIADEFEGAARAKGAHAEAERMVITAALRHVVAGSSPRSARTRRPRCPRPTSRPPLRRSAGARSSARPVGPGSSGILGL
jgi:hypothetical protein